jgi:hypothetical protein
LYQAPIDAQTRTDSPISYKDFLRNSPDILWTDIRLCS